MGESEWVCGDYLTYVDFMFAEVLDMLNALSPDLFYSEFPTLKAYTDRFFVLPNLDAAWGDDTKLMKAPFNNKMAKLLN